MANAWEREGKSCIFAEVIELIECPQSLKYRGSSYMSYREELGGLVMETYSWFKAESTIWKKINAIGEQNKTWKTLQMGTKGAKNLHGIKINKYSYMFLNVTHY